MLQETQQSIRDAFETQPIDDQHAYVVGYDADGSSYLHFPQFCGADLRIYRQSQIRLPKMERPPLEEEMLSDIKLLKVTVEQNYYCYIPNLYDALFMR